MSVIETQFKNGELRYLERPEDEECKSKSLSTHNNNQQLHMRKQSALTKDLSKSYTKRSK